MIGVCGLFFFIVGYARARNDLLVESSHQPLFLQLTKKHKLERGKDDRPRRTTMLAGLAEQEPDFLERIRKCIFG